MKVFEFVVCACMHACGCVSVGGVSFVLTVLGIGCSCTEKQAGDAPVFRTGNVLSPSQPYLGKHG